MAIDRRHGAWIPTDPTAQSGRAEVNALSSQCLELLRHSLMGTFLQLQIPQNYLQDKGGSTVKCWRLLTPSCFNSHGKMFSVSATLCIPWVNFYKEQAAQVPANFHSGLSPVYVDYSSRLGTVAPSLVCYPRSQTKAQEPGISDRMDPLF